MTLLCAIVASEPQALAAFYGYPQLQSWLHTSLMNAASVATRMAVAEGLRSLCLVFKPTDAAAYVPSRPAALSASRISLRLTLERSAAAPGPHATLPAGLQSPSSLLCNTLLKFLPDLSVQSGGATCEQYFELLSWLLVDTLSRGLPDAPDASSLCIMLSHRIRVHPIVEVRYALFLYRGWWADGGSRRERWWRSAERTSC
jgi:hypothetical protein